MEHTSAGKLYIVGTPIGNLGDISVRALETLKSVDFIAAEDTRVAMKLLSHFGISKPLVSYYEHNMRERGEQVIARILSGETCALTTDAGMPVISDPGGMLVRQCREAGIAMEVVPGPCALIAAFALAGLENSRFCFEGFLSMNKRSRREHLASLRGEKRAMIFYEAPHKLTSTIDDFIETFGEDRSVLFARELTKTHEESVRMTLAQAKKRFEEAPPRGEFVLVVDGASDEETAADAVDAMESACALAESLISQGMTKSAAVKAAAQQMKVSKNALYELVVNKT